MNGSPEGANDPHEDLRQFDRRHSEAGRLLRYVKGRTRAFRLRILVALVGAAIIALCFDWRLGLFVGALAFGLEVAEKCILQWVENQDLESAGLVQCSRLAAFGALLQTAGNANAIIWTGLQSDSFRLLAIVYCIGALFNAQLSATHHRLSYLVRAAILIPTCLSFVAFDILSGARLDTNLFVELGAMTMLLVMLLLLFSTLDRRSARQARSDREVLAASVQIADTLSALQISEQEAQRLAHMARNALDGMAAIDAQGMLFWVNSQFEAMTGYKIEEIAGDSQIRMVTDHEENAGSMKILAETRANPATAHVTVQIVHKNGSLRWISIHRSPIFDEAGQLQYFIASWRDITESREQQAKLAAALDAAKVADVEKTAFLQRMSHELRTPLNGIVGGTDLLRDGQLGAEQAEAVALIETSTDRLTRLVEQVLVYTDAPQEAGDDRGEVFEINAFLEQAIAPYLAKARDKSLDLSLSCSSAQEHFLEAQTATLGRILEALLDNAIKFTEEGRIEVGYELVKASRTSALSIWVKDTGPGIAKHLQTKIFEHFSQAEEQTNRSVDGAGLGLSIARTLAGQMGGALDLVSEPGSGSCFTIRVDVTPAQNPNARPEKDPDAFLEDTNLLLLVAEDNKTNRLLISKMFRTAKCQIEFAVDGVDAVEKYCDLKPGLVLMDLSMPRKDGLQATRDIRRYEDGRNLPACPILALTANAYDSDRQNCFDAGMDDFLAKPVRKAALVNAIGAALSRPHVC